MDGWMEGGMDGGRDGRECIKLGLLLRLLYRKDH